VTDAPINPTPKDRTLPDVFAGGSTGTLTLARFIDDAGNFTDPHDLSASVDWGDGTTQSDVPLTQVNVNTFDVLGSHTYEEPCDYTILVHLTDRAGSSAMATAAVKARPGPNSLTKLTDGDVLAEECCGGTTPEVDPPFEPNGRPSDGP